MKKNTYRVIYQPINQFLTKNNIKESLLHLIKDALLKDKTLYIQLYIKDYPTNFIINLTFSFFIVYKIHYRYLI